MFEIRNSGGKIDGDYSDAMYWLEKIKIKRIYLSPHSFLHAIPLHAAFLPGAGRTYFVKDFEVCYTPSLTLSYRLFCSKTNAGKKKAMALFYSPLHRHPLKHGEQEIRNLSDVYGKEQVISLENEEATLEILARRSKEMQEDLSLIELICHGDASSDGISLDLYLKPVSHTDLIRELNLSGLPLAVLAACETGRSNEWQQTYEEYMALDSVFLQMGATGVVSSLYSIDDQGTNEIMKEFHRRMKHDNASPSTALHEAQKKILESGFSSDTTSTTRGRLSTSDRCASSHPYLYENR